MRDHLEFCVESLEQRQMLAAAISFNPNSGLMRITSDADGGSVQLDGGGTIGTIFARVDGQPAGSFLGVNKIVARMGPANDSLAIGSISIGGSLNVNMGNGNDTVSILNTAFDNVSGVIGNVFIGGAVTINMGSGTFDGVSMDAANGFGHTYGNKVTFAGLRSTNISGEGTSRLIEGRDINILGRLSIRNDVDGSSINLVNVNVGGTTTIRGSRYADAVNVVDAAFARRVTIDLGAGDDTLFVAGSANANWFAHRTIFRGGAGQDTLFLQDDNFFADPPSIDFEMVA